ncbi:M23 family metallopeptidase [Thalassococcus sp. BH17M4-6]
MSLPLDCTLGETCFIEDYVDADPTFAQHDYTCGLKSRDGHRGTDFALLDEDAMRAGVRVLAAAPGLVEAVRDGVADEPYTAEVAARIKGRECGNAVRIGHPNGYKTLYCHLKNGSLTVRKGDVVDAGKPLGLVGMSGQSNFAHVHLTVLKDGEIIDPFNPGASQTCGADTPALWRDMPGYDKAGLFTAAFSTSVPSLAHVQSGAARRDSARPDHDLVLYGFAFFAQTGDVVEFEATGPGGQILQASQTIDKGRAQLFRAQGRKAPSGGWPQGSYTGHVTLKRDGRILARRPATIRVE